MAHTLYMEKKQIIAFKTKLLPEPLPHLRVSPLLTLFQTSTICIMHLQPNGK